MPNTSSVVFQSPDETFRQVPNSQGNSSGMCCSVARNRKGNLHSSHCYPYWLLSRYTVRMYTYILVQIFSLKAHALCEALVRQLECYTYTHRNMWNNNSSGLINWKKCLSFISYIHSRMLHDGGNNGLIAKAYSFPMLLHLYT